ncbi:MAG: hypothetical protein ACOYXT_24695 [Bacteroidota bacterium]
MVAKHRLPFMLLAIINLFAGLGTGLVRIGWQFEISNLAPAHGAIMVGGFLGTLISIEKIIPLRNKFLFFIPALSGSSLLLFLLNMPQESILMVTLASLGLVVIFVYYYFKYKDLQYLIMLIGGICWLVGNVLLYSKNFYPASFPLWLGFILFVIVGERIDLMKFMPVTNRAKFLLMFFLAMYLGSTLFHFHGAGNYIAGISLIAVAVWLIKNDMISANISKSALTKYVAIALLCGYISLLICGVFILSLQGSAMAYDAVVHTFFLGFTFSMIFAHGPIILPGVLGVIVKPYHIIFYLFLSLLQASWLMRAFSDSSLNFYLRQISGLLSTVAILGYFASLAIVSINQLRGKTV